MEKRREREGGREAAWREERVAVWEEEYMEGLEIRKRRLGGKNREKERRKRTRRERKKTMKNEGWRNKRREKQRRKRGWRERGDRDKKERR